MKMRCGPGCEANEEGCRKCGWVTIDGVKTTNVLIRERIERARMEMDPFADCDCSAAKSLKRALAVAHARLLAADICPECNHHRVLLSIAASCDECGADLTHYKMPE